MMDLGETTSILMDYQRPNKTWEKCQDTFQALVKETLRIDKKVEVDQCNHVRKQN